MRIQRIELQNYRAFKEAERIKDDIEQAALRVTNLAKEGRGAVA